MKKLREDLPVQSKMPLWQRSRRATRVDVTLFVLGTVYSETLW